MKGHIRIGGSLLLGVALVAGAFSVRGGETTAQTGTLSVLDAPERTYIEIGDRDTDGTPDWENELQKNLISGLDSLVTDSATSSEDETYTGKFARSFFEDFMRGGVSASLENKEAFITDAVESIERSTTQKIFTVNDIRTTPHSLTEVRGYGNEIASTVREHSIQNRSEVLIIAEALDTKNPEMLSELVSIREAYKGMIDDTRMIATPETLIEEHLALLNAYEAILTDISAMEQAFTDPLYTLARIKRYEDDAAALFYAYKNIHTKLNEMHVIYTEEEPGSFFTLFES